MMIDDFNDVKQDLVSCPTWNMWFIEITSEELDVNVPVASSVLTADPVTPEQSSLF